ncbi:minor capsid protein [Campylobacter sp. 9BO]|uniref:phage head morphogenesis protein n=1 Tax=Campylobacter sp. 9BO TaxID=3424759 RepID=UPI003D3444E6
MNLRQIFKSKRSSKLKATTPSKRAEVSYRNQLLGLIKGLKNHLQDSIRRFLEANPTATDAEVFIHITQLIENARKAEILKLATLIATAAVKIANRQNKRQIMANLGIKQTQNLTPLTPNQNKPNIESIIENSPKVKDKLDEYIAKNVSLITSVKNEYLSDVEKAIRANYLQSGHIKNLSTMIDERTNVSKSRARLIARDQIGKLNADLTQERHAELGIKFYIWDTSHDEAVRKTHANINGKLCRYDDDTVYSDDGGKTWKKRTAQMPKAKPGKEIQCRCSAIAYLGDFE